MAITEQCKAEMIKNGVLTVELDDGGIVPAGMPLLSKNVLRIAIVEGDVNGAYPEGFVNDDFSAFLDDGRGYFESLVMGNGGAFPDGIENSVRRSIGYWYDGEVQFVSSDDDPDISIFAFETDGDLPVISMGKASFPANNHDNENYASYGGDQAYVAINVGLIGLADYSDVVMNGGSFNDAIEDFLRHEFGHTFAVLHPHEAGEEVKADSDRLCSDVEIDALQQYFANAIMSVDSASPDEVRAESEYDAGVRDYIQRGVAPRPDDFAKP